MRPHHACKRIAVGYGNCGKPKLGRADKKLVRVRSALQKGEIRRYLQLGVSGLFWAW
jgi:hypothetical protein